MKTVNFKSVILNIEAWFHSLVWTLFFLSINVNWTESWVAESFLPESVAPHMAIAIPTIFLLNTFWLIPKYLNKKNWYHYVWLSLSLLIGLELIRTLMFSFVLQSETSFSETLKTELFGENSLIFGFLNVMIFYAIFYSFVYRFTRDWLFHRSIIERLKVEKQQLQARSLQLVGQADIFKNTHFQLENEVILESKPFKKVVSVKKRDGTFLLKIEDVIYFQAQGDFVFAFDNKEQKHIINESLKSIRELVCSQSFFQINRSEIVNFNYIKKFNSYTKNRLEISLFHSHECVFTSNSRTPDFRDWIDQH